MLRLLAVPLLCATLSNALQAAPVLNAVEFPFAQYPRQLWERELVWMKNIGVQTVALDAHAPSEEADLMLILRTIRKLNMTVWLRLDPTAQSLARSLEPMQTAHGGPIAYWNNAVPQPITRLSATYSGALATSRTVLATTRGTLLWVDVEDTLRPEYRKGAISFQGEESPSIGSLRRDVLLFGYWQAGIDKLTTGREVRPAESKLPEGVAARQLLTADATGASAISIVNRSKLPFHGDLRVLYPPAKRHISLLGIDLPAGESLWLPVNIPLARGAFCKNCGALGNDDSIVYATSELIDAEYENGILAMEFAAPTAGEVILHLAQEPSGPYLAAGRPNSFDWDPTANRVRLKVPAGKAPSYRVRVGLALEPPDNSAFFEDARILIIGQKNVVTTSYTSEAIAARSRLRGPAELKFEAVPKPPLQVDYTVTVPPTELHGDHLELALEADGVQMGHVRLQLLRPVSLRVREAISRHFGDTAELPLDPAIVSMDQRAGRSITVSIRNNFPSIQTFTLDMKGEGLDFSPARQEVSIAASSERDVSIRVFPVAGATGVHQATAMVSGAGEFTMPLLFALIPRGETLSYTAGGVNILEDSKVRAVFADAQMQRWLEFTWKDSDRNVLPESGVDLGPGTRRIHLKEAELTIEQESSLPPEKIRSGKRGDILLQIQRPAAGKAVYTLSR